jgi:hypothetical protein
MFAAQPILAQAHLDRQVKEDHTLLRDLQSNLLAIDESVFNSEHNPKNVMMSNYDFLTEKQHAIRRLWRIRRFLRQRVGLPVDPNPPQKTQKTVPPGEEYDPEATTVGPPYDPTEQHSPRAPAKSPSLDKPPESPSFSLNESDYYDEPTPRSRVSTPTSLP